MLEGKFLEGIHTCTPFKMLVNPEAAVCLYEMKCKFGRIPNHICDDILFAQLGKTHKARSKTKQARSRRNITRNLRVILLEYAIHGSLCRHMPCVRCNCAVVGDK